MTDADMPAVSLQASFWDEWNSTHREKSINDVSRRQAEVVCRWLDDLRFPDPEILEVGCGSGWFCRQLSRYGRVTATDLSASVLARAKESMPEVDFVAGDFMAVDFGRANFDVIVTLEVLSHVADPDAFLAKIKRHLRPGGYLMMATQNRPVLEKFNNIPPPQRGQLRLWFDRRELKSLLERHFAVRDIFSVSPKATRGIMRILNSNTVNRPIRALIGNRFDRLKERLGFGWTLMALAQAYGDNP